MSPNNAHKRQKLGLKDFSDSKILSDITIRYGPIGERIFEAHRIVLSSKSYWFKAAFTGGFAESSARDITLKEDDPDALKTMREFAYDEDSLHPDELAKGTPIGIRHALGLYRVGDKYDFPRFRDCTISCFKLRLEHWLSQPSLGDDAAHKDFCDIVREVYDIVGPDNHTRQKLVVALLETIDDVDSTRILNNTGGKQRSVVEAAQEVAPFGRDSFLHLMAKTGSSAVNEFGLRGLASAAEISGTTGRPP
ncbi:hypothetical protein J4E85_003759 [Alternaria conjuncta]|uniref:uncharacterized protein n=1 Tax=Alternaria conjuncta TaxID=181017 RepID=UPI00221F2ED3|nr:uncharacterized protein J4E85_003759 [Alternaria conjuncta]KAI4931170.1 hypothetical protein J4E85_003759 [Alternaria conjuncta]